jgi:alpha/beta superfamily hydrolase
MLHSDCEDRQIRALIAAGTPVSKYDFTGKIDCGKPKLFVQGGMDEFGSVQDLERFVAALGGTDQIRVIDGADHFFEGCLDELARVVRAFISSVE